MTPLQERAADLSSRINWLIERIIALLMALLVADVWLGVVARYVLRVQIPWTEELARYLMIWAALLAISSGIARREHIGFRLLQERFPSRLQKALLISFDGIAFAFFAFLFVYGIGMTGTGTIRHDFRDEHGSSLCLRPRIITARLHSDSARWYTGCRQDRAVSSPKRRRGST